tara:strand:+ start:2728 stop:4464 length:1737 start_codon:yes stop_codon:yes gene_type:complete
MTLILGINAFHADSSACLIKDGEILFAIEEERINRIKHWSGFPVESIKACLEFENIALNDIDYITFNINPKFNLKKKILYILKNFLIAELFRYFKKKNKNNIFKDLKKNFEIKDLNKKIIFVEHHLSHISSAYFPSNFQVSDIVSMDGFGDFTSCALGSAKGNDLKVTKRVNFPHSLGLFYQAMTQHLGFNSYGDEYKVMGLSAYGKPKYFEDLKKIINVKEDVFELNLKNFTHQNNFSNYVSVDGNIKYPRIFSSNVVKIIGNQRLQDHKINEHHADLAASTQKMYEHILYNTLNQLQKITKNENLCFAGGCAMNSKANGSILENTNYKKIYIPPSPGDSGGSVGSALYHNSKLKGFNKSKNFYSVYLGPSYDYKYTKELINTHLKNYECEILNLNKIELADICARKISEGNVIGWFQSRMEWGPRALGNRSILADPRNKNMKDILNLKTKKRESFRPFAPSILVEEVENWFEENHQSHFMQNVYKFQKDKVDLIPAVVHLDFTGRLQTVSRELNPTYYDLIKNFHKITKIPIILNTSFNENEPIVCNPLEAINCFKRTKIDILVIDDFYIQRSVKN